MPKHKVIEVVGTPDQVLAGLTERDVYPLLVAAEKKLATAERTHEEARAELRRLETEVATLPAEIQAGRRRVDSFDRARRERDRVAGLLPEQARAVATAKGDVAAAEKAAQLALATEVGKRRAELQRQIDGSGVAALLEAWAELDAGLEQALGRTYLDRVMAPPAVKAAAGRPIEWPSSPLGRFNERKARGVAAVAGRRIGQLSQPAAAPAPATARHDTSIAPPSGSPTNPFTGRPRGAKDW